MHDLIELLRRFNRKERYFLVKQSLGNFTLGYSFRKILGREIDLEIPSDAFVAMDYHLDWLAAALRKWKCGNNNTVFGNPAQSVVTGTQQDIDLLIAFKNDAHYYVVLVEAKGVSGWNNAQMLSKANRLKQIFGFDGDCFEKVTPHFCLISPRRPQNLKTREWPKWMKRNEDKKPCNWLELDFPCKRIMPVRCNKGGTNSAEGEYFKVNCLKYRRNR